MNARKMVGDRIIAVINHSATRYNSLPNYWGTKEQVAYADKYRRINERAQTLSSEVRHLEVEHLERRCKALEKDLKELDQQESLEQQKNKSNHDARVNNSRPRIGETRKVSLTLPGETWKWLEEQIMFRHQSNMSGLLRSIIEHAKEGE